MVFVKLFVIILDDPRKTKKKHYLTSLFNSTNENLKFKFA